MSWSEIATKLTALQPELFDNVRKAMEVDQRFTEAGFTIKRAPILDALYDIVKQHDAASHADDSEVQPKERP